MGYTYRVKRRAQTSVEIFRYEPARARGFSPIFITAGFAALALIGVVVWEVNSSVHASSAPTVISGNPSGTGTDSASLSTSGTTSTTTSGDPLSSIGAIIVDQLQGAYQQMQLSGTYSTTSAQRAAESLAPYVVADVSYPTFSAGDLKTDTTTSYARMLQYRSDLRVSLSPLLKNTQPEYEIFAYYVNTKDASYLKKLQAVAENYYAAATSTAKVIVPADAVSYHIAILNAMEEFGATLSAMATHADDPFASVALLRTYNRAEADMFTSFNSLTTYYKSKTP